jgi:hypothetical protein
MIALRVEGSTRAFSRRLSVNISTNVDVTLPSCVELLCILFWVALISCTRQGAVREARVKAILSVVSMYGSNSFFDSLDSSKIASRYTVEPHTLVCFLLLLAKRASIVKSAEESTESNKLSESRLITAATC